MACAALTVFSLSLSLMVLTFVTRALSQNLVGEEIEAFCDIPARNTTGFRIKQRLA